MTRTVASLLIYFLIVGLRCSGTDVQSLSERRVLRSTVVTISLYAENEPETWKQDIGKAFAEMDCVEKIRSSNIPASAIGQINRLAGREYVSVDLDVLELLAQARSIAEISSGAFDVTVWPLRCLRGIDSENPHAPAPKDLEKAMKLVDYSSVAMTDSFIRLNLPGSGIDLGGIAKEYAVDQAVSSLSGIGYTDFMVEAGGDLRAMAGELTRDGRKIWIQHPRDPDSFFAYFEMDEGAVATSGEYEHFLSRVRNDTIAF